MAAIRDGRIPIDRRRQPRIDVGERVGDNMRGGEPDAIECVAPVPFQARGPRSRYGSSRPCMVGKLTTGIDLNRWWH